MPNNKLLNKNDLCYNISDVRLGSNSLALSNN